jgi:PAS domain S-box-containing protein
MSHRLLEQAMSGRLAPEVYEELMQHSVDVLTVLDTAGAIQYESPSIERVLGYDPDELIGDEVFDYVHPDDREAALETFYEVIEADGDYTTGAVELRFRHRDGSWVWLESRGSNQMASAIDGYLVTSRDISARKEYEQRLQRERNRLDRFASVISHDLRNPLNVASGRVELAQEACDSDHLDRAERALTRMDELIDDVLRVTRAGDAEPVMDAVSLETIAEDCWQTLETNDATLTVETTATIIADAGQLKQVLENLFRNAIDHGGAAVTVVVDTFEDGFYVADDGPGVPASTATSDSLYEPGVSTKADGTGLGLSIVRELIENHGWRLQITNGDLGGARIEIRDVTFA